MSGPDLTILDEEEDCELDCPAALVLIKRLQKRIEELEDRVEILDAMSYEVRK